jgi:activator of HSP90 ATPase
MGTTIRQTVTLKASPAEVFAMLMDSRKHSRFTGSPASISRKPGGKVSAYNGYALGVNLEIVADRKIVQTWRASDWPEGVESTVTYLLERIRGGTRLRFTQTGVPGEHVAAIRQGWKDFYWMPLRAALKE